MAGPKVTIAQALREGVEQLTLSDAPQMDAEYLLLHALEADERSWLHTHATDVLPAGAHAKYVRLLSKRTRGVPLAYLLGSWEFYGREFTVTPDVLIPRPTTEELITKSLAVIRQLRARNDHPLTVADVGCGSGCIAVTLALETTPEEVHHIIATDISAAALRVAKKNATRHSIASRLTFLQGNMLEPLPDRSINLVVSNPPYIPSLELAAVKVAPLPHTRGLAFEPAVALDGGPDGNMFVQQLSQSGIPSVVETTGGHSIVFNLI